MRQDHIPMFKTGGSEASPSCAAHFPAFPFPGAASANDDETPLNRALEQFNFLWIEALL